MKKIFACCMAVMMAMGLLSGCSAKNTATTSTSGNTTTEAAKTDTTTETKTDETTTETTASDQDAGKPDTWIADRHLVGRSFIDDQGESLPGDQLNNDMMTELRNRTGMDIEWQYTAGTSDLDVMTTALAAGDLPDLIVSYLNNSSRKEFPILMKGAREGLFTDITPLIKNTKIYSKYFEDGYLPDDTKNGVMWRPEFNGAAYFVHMNIKRVPEADEWKGLGGMKLQRSIAEALNVDIKSIKTQDDFVTLLRKIKEGGFTDNNGAPVFPLGPRIWGGSYSGSTNVIENYNFGSASEGFDYLDGKVQYDVMTDYVIQQIMFYRQLFAEKLINPEFFTMDPTRADEASRANSSAVIASAHGLVDMFRTEDYTTLFLQNTKGEQNVSYESYKTGYCVWAIPSTAKNPQEIVDFLDYLATYEGKLLNKYGIEGVHFDIKDGFPAPKSEYMQMVKDGEMNKFYDTGLWSQGFISDTDVWNEKDFGEQQYGARQDPDAYAFSLKQWNEWPTTRIFVDGFGGRGFLQDKPELEANLNPLFAQADDIKVSAVFAKTDADAIKIIENYRTQLKNAGIEEFCAYLDEVYTKNPKAIKFINKK